VDEIGFEKAGGVCDKGKKKSRKYRSARSHNSAKKGEGECYQGDWEEKDAGDF